MELGKWFGWLSNSVTVPVWVLVVCVLVGLVLPVVLRKIMDELVEHA